MYSTFSKRCTICVIATFLRKNTIFAALPRTVANFQEKKVVLILGPSQPPLTASFPVSNPDVFSRIRNGCFSVFCGFLSVKLLYNTCHEFRSYLMATSQLLRRRLALTFRQNSYVSMTSLISYIKSVAVIRIQNFIAVFPDPLQTTNTDTFDSPQSSTELSVNTITHQNNNNNASISHPNDDFNTGNTVRINISISNLSSYLPKLCSPLNVFERRDKLLPHFDPIPLPKHRRIPSASSSQSSASVCDRRDPALLVSTLRLAADTGSRSASFNLGMMYFRGAAVQQDQKLAHKYFEMGSYLGDTSSAFLSYSLKSKQNQSSEG